MITTRHDTGHHAEDCTCNSCAAFRDDAPNMPMLGEPFVALPDSTFVAYFLNVAPDDPITLH